MKIAKNQTQFPTFTANRKKNSNISLKTKNFNLYYGNLHMKYYNIC